MSGYSSKMFGIKVPDFLHVFDNPHSEIRTTTKIKMTQNVKTNSIFKSTPNIKMTEGSK